ncbi:hypothetical protein KAR91_51035 [Candidatus Pacearchaeota archaeon]|nr:hypothetical protein [Candidatus Pacearchaeota archaeon]
MADIKQDSDGDIFLNVDDLELTSGINAKIQHLRQRLRTFLGEWFLDLRIGVAYFQQIMIKNPNPAVVDSILKKEIINTPGILQLTFFDLNVSRDRLLTLSFRALTQEGEVNFSEVIP